MRTAPAYQTLREQLRDDIAAGQYSDGARLPTESELVEHPRLSGQPVLALAGLARPGGFLRTLGELGAEVWGTAFFPDHHRFSERELHEVSGRAASLGARVVTTEKDQVRLPGGFETWTVRLGVEVLEGESHLRRALGLG